MNAADRRRLTPALGAAGVALALLLIALWSGFGRGARWHDDGAAPRLPETGAAQAAPEVPPLDHFAEVWQKPLFSPTRTPEAVASGDGATRGDLELTGVIMLPGLRMAIVHDKTTGRDYRVVEGDAPGNGPALLELHPRSAVVDTSGTRLDLRLLPGASPRVDAASPSAAPQAQSQPAHSAGAGASAMVSRRAGQDAARSRMSGTGAGSAEARAQALKARIEAERRRAQSSGGG
ncbi:MAG: hypothetical protein ACREPL_06160 [Rhodanobacteraceae bacterium]